MKLTKLMTTGGLIPLVWFNLAAEEGGAGHYLTGAASSFIDQLPGKPALAVADFFTSYDASTRLDKALNLGGQVAFGAKATVYADTLVGIYQTPLQILGGLYAVGAAVPYVWLEVKADVQRTGVSGGTRRVSVRDTANGFGDVTLYPFMLGWTNGPDLKYDIRCGVYAPTGGYNVGDLANLGKNYWTFEPGATFSWLSSKIGTEATVFAGFDINTENQATHYHSGASFHLDGTLAQHLPLFGGVIGVGANGFFYQQITPDGGSGANLGNFEGHTVGVGPVASYAYKVRGVDIVGEVKWLPELDVTKRLKGDYVWVKVAVVF